MEQLSYAQQVQNDLLAGNPNQQPEVTADKPAEQPQTAATEAASQSRKFNLKFGYQDKEDPEMFHREVVISRRPTGADILRATENGAGFAGADTQINLALIASSISCFGALTKINGMPATASILLSLNEIDEDKLNDEYLLFLIATQPKTEQKILEDKRAQLAFGIERGGVKYNIVEFGKLLNGFDRIKIQDEANGQWEYTALKMASEAVKISTLDSSQLSLGELTLDEIKAMDATDFIVLREAESQWLNSFRD